MAESCSPTVPPRPRLSSGRVRRWIAVLALLLVTGFALLYHTLTRPERVRRRCAQYIRRFVDAEVTIESATFGILDGIHLTGVRVTETGSADTAHAPQRPFFSCRDVLLKLAPAALLVGELSVREVLAVNPVCTLVHTDETGEYNVGRILRRTAPRGPANLPRPPIVRLRNASLIIAREDGGVRREVERINLNVVATPKPGPAATYSVAWTCGDPDAGAGRATCDLATLSFNDSEGGLPWLSLETAMLAVVAQAPDAAHWFSLLGFTGQIKAEDFGVALRAGRAQRTRLTLRVREAALAIPVDEVEQSFPRAERYLRFDGVNGAVHLSPARADIGFTGTFHGARCRVSATLEGQIGSDADLNDVSVSATIRCDDLTLPSVGETAEPAAARFVKRWRALRSFYNDFDPHGRVALELSVVKRAGTGEPLRLERGVMTVVHADAAFRKFPYRVDNLTGTVEITPDGIHLRELSGDHKGAPVVVEGWLAEARWYTASELHITGQDVSLDADLYRALSPRYQKLWDTFELAGAADIVVEMTRAAGTADHPQPYATRIDAELTGASARFAGFPYPVVDLSGSLTIEGDRLSVTRLSGRNGAATVVVEGHADLALEGLSDLNLRLEAEHVAFDDALFAALPEDAAVRVGHFAPRGTFDLVGDITFDPSTRRAMYDLAATLRNVKMTCGDVPVPVEQVAGKIRMRPRHITVEQLTARRGESTVTVDGVFSSAVDAADAHAVVTCNNLLVDEALLAALPTKIGAVCRDLRITGPVKTITRYGRSGPVDAPVASLRTTIDAAGASINPVQFPYPLKVSRGTVDVESERITFQGLRATHGDTTVTLDGVLTSAGEAVEGAFTVSGAHIVLDEDLRLAVPWRWRRAWNKVSPTGIVDLDLEQLRYHRGRSAPAADWSFNGRLKLDGAGLNVGVRLADAGGALVGSGSVAGVPGELSASAKIALDAVTVKGRRVENLRGALDKSAAGRALALRDLSGELYGGLISADVQVHFEESVARYDVSATMQDVELRDFLRAGESEAPHESLTGKMDARIFVNGSFDDPESRVGGGMVEVRNAELYRFPLVMAILNVLNFTAPEESAFQAMSAEFFISGRRVETKNIILRGTALALIGSGAIVPAAGTLALKLVAVTPHRSFEVPVLTELLEGAARELVEIDVHGPLADPAIEARPLRSVEAAFNTLLEKKKPKARGPVKPEEE